MVCNLQFKQIGVGGLAGGGDIHFYPRLVMRAVINAYWGKDVGRTVFLKMVLARAGAFPEWEEMAECFRSLHLPGLLKRRRVTDHYLHLDGTVAIEAIYDLPRGFLNPKIVKRVLRKDLGYLQQRLSRHIKAHLPR